MSRNLLVSVEQNTIHLREKSFQIQRRIISLLSLFLALSLPFCLRLSYLNLHPSFVPIPIASLSFVRSFSFLSVFSHYLSHTFFFFPPVFFPFRSICPSYRNSSPHFIYFIPFVPYLFIPCLL